MSPWSLYLGPPAPSGGLERELTTARNRRFAFRLNSGDEYSFQLSGHHAEASYIDELRTDMHVLRMHPNGTRQILGRGRIGPSGDTVDGQGGHDCSFAAHGYRTLLERRILYATSQLVWSGVDQVGIGYGLIAQTQALPGGNLGIIPGLNSGGTNTMRDRTYEAGDNIGQRLTELGEVIGGFEWDITPIDPVQLAYDVWFPQRGSHVGVLEYGGAIASFSRQVGTQDFANAGRVSGKAPDGGGDEPTPVETTGVIGAEGRFDKTYGTDIVLSGSLAERAAWQVAESQVLRPTYTVRLRPGAWLGPQHVWLGDTVRLRIKSGRLRVDTDYRVHEVTVSLDDDGQEDVELTLGGPRPDYRKRAVDVERRLLNLERR